MSDTFAQHSVEIARLSRALEIERRAYEQIKKTQAFRRSVLPLAFPMGTVVIRRGVTAPQKFVVIGYDCDRVKCFPFSGSGTEAIEWTELIRDQDAQPEAAS